MGIHLTSEVTKKKGTASSRAEFYFLIVRRIHSQNIRDFGFFSHIFFSNLPFRDVEIY